MCSLKTSFNVSSDDSGEDKQRFQYSWMSTINVYEIPDRNVTKYEGVVVEANEKKTLRFA